MLEMDWVSEICLGSSQEAQHGHGFLLRVDMEVIVAFSQGRSPLP